ncbi:MAG: NADH-quinone oxidoreductase subunit M, partial [Nitrospirota bacterium]
MEDIILNQLKYPILTVTVFLPLIGALLILFMKNARSIRWTALFVAICTLLVALPLLTNFDKTTYKMQFVEKHAWIQSWGLEYYVGIDGISILFIFLTALLSIFSVLVSWKAIETKVKEFHLAILIMEAGMLGVFV